MTVIKLAATLPKGPAEALAEHADRMHRTRKGHWMAIVEFAHHEQVNPRPDDEREPVVKVRIATVEIADEPFDDEQLRKALARLYARRTAAGTLDEATAATDGGADVELVGHGDEFTDDGGEGAGGDS